MHKLVEVEEARELFEVAKDWGVWKWLFEKKRARAAADRANEALDELEKKVKASWGDDLKTAYREVELEASMDGNAKARRQYLKAKEEARNVSPEIKAAAKRVRDADAEAWEAHLDAERIFDDAERVLSASMARQGAERAIVSWDLHEKAIRKAEAAGRRK